MASWRFKLAGIALAAAASVNAFAQDVTLRLQFLPPQGLVIGVLKKTGVDLHCLANNFFSSALSESQAGSSAGRGVSLASAGITPSFFCRANACSR